MSEGRARAPSGSRSRSPSRAADATADQLLTVIVTIVDGGPTLHRLLQALEKQVRPPPLEVIIPYDASVAPEVEALATEFPEFSFLDIGAVTPEKPIASAAGQHELYDRRRARGLAAATGALISVLEDRGAPRPDWAATVARLHRELPHAVIGGAIEPEPDSLLNWALFVCDFERFSLPFESGPREWISDINVSYKRRAVENTREIWKHRFHEPLVHWALAEQGETLYLSSEMVVDHKCPAVPLTSLLQQRVSWGRLFGHIRARKMSPARRLVLSLLGPIVPLRLLLRHGVAQGRKRRLARYLQAAPVVLLLTIFWTWGEVGGYLSRRP